MVEIGRYLTIAELKAEVRCDIRFVSPYVDAGEIMIQADEVLLADMDDSEGTVICTPMRYRELHSFFVPAEIRTDYDYTGMYWLVIQLQVLRDYCMDQVDICKRFVNSSSLDHKTINSMIGDGEEYECDLVKCPSCSQIFLLYKSQGMDWDCIIPDPDDLFEYHPVTSERLFQCLNCGKPFIEEENWDGKRCPQERTSVCDARISSANQLWLNSCRLDQFRVPYSMLKGSGWTKWLVGQGVSSVGDSTALHFLR
jgi:DNA-directed RNA polymerase subunit RPC12/RpoP